MPGLPAAGGSPSDVVRQAFDRLGAHDLAGLATLACVGQRQPDGLALPISGLTSPFASVPGPGFVEALDMTTIDVSRVRVEPVEGDGQAVVQVPVSGELWLTVDADRAEAAIRAAVAVDTLPPDEATIVATLDAMRAPARPSWTSSRRWARSRSRASATPGSCARTHRVPRPGDPLARGELGVVRLAHRQIPAPRALGDLGTAVSRQMRRYMGTNPGGRPSASPNARSRKI
jgi:hypothetical protein